MDLIHSVVMKKDKSKNQLPIKGVNAPSGKITLDNK